MYPTVQAALAIAIVAGLFLIGIMIARAFTDRDKDED